MPSAKHVPAPSAASMEPLQHCIVGNQLRAAWVTQVVRAAHNEDMGAGEPIGVSDAFSVHFSRPVILQCD